MNSLLTIKRKIENKIDRTNIKFKMSPREKTIYEFINNNAGCQSGQIAEQLEIPNPTVKRILSNMVERSIVRKHGQGRSTNYTVGT